MKILELQQSPAAFRGSLLIDTDAGPQPLAQVIDDWQAEDFRALDNGWRRAAGQEVEGDGYQRAWLERGRGHSKSSDVMVSATWALFASRRPLSGIVAAVDRDQAAIDRDCVARLLGLNSWLADILEVQQWRIVNRHTGSSLEIISSDVASSYGLLVDFIVADEVTLWPKRDLFDSLLSAAAKRANCLLLCIGNSGFVDSWQFQLREQIRDHPRWYFSRLDGPVASWISGETLAEQEKLLPPAAYQRLWLNVWSAGAGDAISAADIAAAFRSDLQPTSHAEPGWEYVAGVDAGVSRDASALCVLGIRRDYEGHGRIRLAYAKVWRPVKGKKVDLGEVEFALLDSHKRYVLKQINFDPWELRYLASRLQAGGLGRMTRPNDVRTNLPLVEVPPTAANLQRQASVLLEAFGDRRLELYSDPELKRDISRMRIEERSYGFRVVSPRDSLGHGDVGSAFCLAMLAASEIAAHPTIVLGSMLSDHQLPAERWAKRVREYEEVQAVLAEADDPDADWKRFMRLCGRC